MAEHPYRNFRFRLEIDGLEAGGFSEVTGFDANIDVIEYREGDSVITPRKLPGLIKYGNVTLKWGATDSMVLYEWLQGIAEGQVERKTVTITAIDEAGEDAASWQLIEAWPVKYTAPDFNGLGAEVAMETLEMAHEGLTRVQ
ncbi:phage tail protein [Crassaminicella profunda]|uniref:phage tail protein n=1 Tax=Crassaminicella profunda TaxID=1286698 RepID=UPI001CA62FB6|nr:phage tail protein [Crassaminicella profunda]QZY54478.1 phage tail protein [Crassaminicella profunda]